LSTGAPFSVPPTENGIAATRLFEGPLLRTKGTPSTAENAELAATLRAVAVSPEAEPFGPVQAFLRLYPRSGWRASLLVNIGAAYRATGRVSRAIETFEEAWTLTSGGTG